MSKIPFLLIAIILNFNQYFSQSNITWESNGNGGKKTKFNKQNETDWIENDGSTSYYYTQIKVENNEYTLSDKNRQGVYIYLNSNTCYYKDNNTDWVVIYYGKWSGTNSNVVNSSNVSSNSTQNTTVNNNTTTSNINNFESNVNNISDINSRLKYIQNVIGTAASQNDTKLLTKAIIQYNSNILSDPNIDKELFIFGRLINESSLPQILQNGISEDEKSMFSVSSFYYVMCQLNIENNFDALNKDIVNGILNNFSSNSYFSKDLYLALEKKKNEISNSTSPSNQSTETAKSEKYNEWLRNVKIEYVNNYSGNKCKWCSTNVQCEKKSQEKLVDDVNSGKMAVKFMIFFGLDVFSSLDQPLEIDLYNCPEFCSLKCENDYRKAGY